MLLKLTHQRIIIWLETKKISFFFLIINEIYNIFIQSLEILL